MAGRVLRLAVLFEGGLFALALGLGWVLGYPPLTGVDFGWEGLAGGVLATVAPLVALWWCAWTRWAPLRRLMREVERVVAIFAGCSHFELALISLLAGIGEETLFRGVIQTALADWLNPWGAWVVASGLFGLGHFITPAYAVVAVFFGLYLGALLLVSGNLLPPMIAHTLYDFFAMIYLLRRHRAITRLSECSDFEDRITEVKRDR